jgi:hypothetical protein
MNGEYDAIIPHKYVARDYQAKFLWEVQKAIEGKSKVQFFYQIWHRRSGKDKTDMADPVPRRLINDPCLVKYVYPTSIMGRDNLWEGIGGDGFKYIDHIPDVIRAGEPNDTRMTIKVKNNTDVPSIFQVAGANKPDALRGGNPKLYVFSEWAEHDPYSWDVVEPILKENGGIAIFNTTPKGDNHARALLEYAKNNPLWYVDMLTAEDTGIWTPQQLEEILKDVIKRFAANGRSESEATAYFEQEYMCSFKAPVVGSYYGAAMQRADKEERITRVPVDETVPVHTAWDLGMDDSMTIWFFQHTGKEFHFVDYYENSGEGIGHYIKVLQERGYYYGKHFAPHDIAVREIGTGKARKEVAKSLGISFEQGPKLDPDDGINAVRSMFSQFWFDADKCHRGINALKNYQKKWDEKNKVFMNTALHNWASHGADAMRTFAVGYKEMIYTGGAVENDVEVDPY